MFPVFDAFRIGEKVWERERGLNVSLTLLCDAFGIDAEIKRDRWREIHLDLYTFQLCLCYFFIYWHPAFTLTSDEPKEDDEDLNPFSFKEFIRSKNQHPSIVNPVEVNYSSISFLFCSAFRFFFMNCSALALTHSLGVQVQMLLFCEITECLKESDSEIEINEFI